MNKADGNYQNFFENIFMTQNCDIGEFWEILTPEANTISKKKMTP